MKVSIPNPCTEKWEAMAERGDGRFCASCEKTLVDFTKMNDKDFISYFQNFKNNTCGRFTEKQLSIEIPNRSISLVPFRRISKYVAASMITAAGLSGKVLGQESMIIQNPVQTIDTKATDTTYTGNRDIVIKGKVLDWNGEALVGALIKIAGTNYGTNTDLDGFFELRMTTTAETKFYELNLSYAGYNSKNRIINIEDISSPVIFEYKESDMVLLVGDVIIVKENGWRHFKRWIRNNLF